MNTLKSIFFLIFLSAPVCFIQAQDWQFDFINIADLYNPHGQKNMVITSSAQDKDGFIWLVANEGVLRYDGVSLFPFAQKFNDKIIPYTFLGHQMRIGHDKDIWLISKSKGVLRIQANGQGIKTVEVPDQGNSTISDIYFENDSIAWFTTSDYRLHKYHLKNQSWQSFTTKLHHSAASDFSFGSMIQDLEKPNHLWIGSKNGLFLFDRNTSSFDFYKLEKPYTFYTREWPVPIHHFHGNILIGAPGSIGIDAFHIVKKSFDLQLDIPRSFDGRGYSNVLSFLNYSDSLVLVGTNDRDRMGIIILNSDGEINYFLNDYSAQEGALENTQQIIRSEDGSIRAIGSKGITRIYQQKNRFSFYRFSKGSLAKNNWQRSFLQLDDADKFLLGTYRGDGLIEVDWKKKSHRNIPYLSKEGFYNYDVTMRALDQDAEGQIWIGSDQGLLVCDLDRSIISQHSKIRKHPILSKAKIHFLKYHQSKLLINTENEGTYSWDFEKNSITELAVDKAIVIHTVLEMKNEWWLGTNKGIKKFDTSSFQTTDFQHLDKNIEVMDMCKIGDSIWLSTKEHGLWNLKNPEDSIWESQKFLNSESYRSNFLHRMVWFNNKNKIWLNTAYGFSSFDILNHRFENYTIKDGIGFSRRNSPIFHQVSDGAIIAGANRSFQYFYPDSISKTSSSPRPYLKELAFNGNVLSMDINGNYNMPKNSNHISFKMGALNLNSNPQNYFSYRLIGVDEEWSNWLSEDFTSYSNLKGGSYKFEFRVANKFFNWVETKTISFQIQKKWTETLIFRVFFLASILGLIYLFYLYRNRQMRREAEIDANYKKQITELQLNALQSQMNPHFVFNSINSINYFIIKNDRDQASNYLAKFSRLIRQILENSKSKLITLEQELEAINLYLEIEQLRFEGKFSFEIEIDEQVQLSSIQIPPLIIQPYIENAIWHGLMNKVEVGHLFLHIKNSGNQVQCIIEDDGIGRKAAAEMNTGKGMQKQSLGTQITKDRLKYIEEMYGIQTNVEILDLVHMDGSAAGTRVTIDIPKLKLKHSWQD